MSQKYSQPGYQDRDRKDRPKDNDRDDRNQHGHQKRDDLSIGERHQLRGLRKATDRQAREVIRCHVCGVAVDADKPILPHTNCPKCSAALHCCRTCRHFDSDSRYQCRAEIPAALPDKLKANSCDQYEPRKLLDHTGRRVQPKRKGNPNDPKEKFKALFKD